MYFPKYEPTTYYPYPLGSWGPRIPLAGSPLPFCSEIPPGTPVGRLQGKSLSCCVYGCFSVCCFSKYHRKSVSDACNGEETLNPKTSAKRDPGLS